MQVNSHIGKRTPLMLVLEMNSPNLIYLDTVLKEKNGYKKRLFTEK